MAAAEAMRLFKCFAQSSETKDEREKRSLEYTQEGNVGPVGDVPMSDRDNNSNAETNNKNKNAENPKTIKQKTTVQMAKSVPYLQSSCRV